MICLIRHTLLSIQHQLSKTLINQDILLIIFVTWKQVHPWNFNNEKSLRVDPKDSTDSISRYICSAATGLYNKNLW